MRRVQGQVPELKLVSFTVDPERDTPAVLDRYAGRFDAERDRWHFLTGSMQRLHDLSRNVFHLGDVDGKLEHATKMALVDRRGKIRGYYASDAKEDVERLILDAAALVKESKNR